MPLAVFPPELSQGLQVQGFSSSLPDRRISMRPARGRPWMRGAPSKLGGRPIQATTVPWTIPYVATFWRFWRDDLAEGTKPFLFRNQQIDGLPEMDEHYEPVLDEEGQPVLITAYWKLLFDGEPPPETPLGGNLWQLGFNLVALD